MMARKPLFKLHFALGWWNGLGNRHNSCLFFTPGCSQAQVTAPALDRSLQLWQRPGPMSASNSRGRKEAMGPARPLHRSPAPPALPKHSPSPPAAGGIESLGCLCPLGNQSGLTNDIRRKGLSASPAFAFQNSYCYYSQLQDTEPGWALPSPRGLLPADGNITLPQRSYTRSVLFIPSPSSLPPFHCSRARHQAGMETCTQGTRRTHCRALLTLGWVSLWSYSVFQKDLFISLYT